MKTSSEINEIAAAFLEAQKNIGKAHKDSKNPFFKSKYSSLASVYDACISALLDQSISVLQPTSIKECQRYHPRHEEYIEQTQYGEKTKIRPNHDNPVSVMVHSNVLETTLLHSSGQWIQGEYLFMPEVYTPQGDGSAFTYARRYALAAMVGVCPEDDDAEAATNRKTSGREKKPAPKTDKAKELRGEILDLLTKAYHGSTEEDKNGKKGLIMTSYGTDEWKEIEKMDVIKLEAGLVLLRDLVKMAGESDETPPDATTGKK
jgi:hypothetical protein